MVKLELVLLLISCLIAESSCFLNSITREFMTPKFQYNIMSILHNETLAAHKHCEEIHETQLKKWSFYEAKVGHRELQDFLTLFRNDIPYFPMGAMENTSNHSLFSKLVMGYVFFFMALSLTFIVILIPFPCWGSAWKSVLSNPYSGFQKVNEADDI